MRRLWLSACVLVPLLVLSVPVSAIAAIWLGSGRLGAISGVLLIVCLPAMAGFCFWTEDAKPERAMPRDLRRRLRAEQDRIRLDAEIAKAEKEAGLR